MFEFRPADWSENIYLANQRGVPAGRHCHPLTRNGFPNRLRAVAGPENFNKAEEIASCNMGAREKTWAQGKKTCRSIFTVDLSKAIVNVYR